MTLREELEAFAARGRATHDAGRKAIYAAAAEAIAGSPILQEALRVGDTAPMFELPDADGNVVRLAYLLETGPVIVSFYRGAWCPFCNLELRALQRARDAIDAAGTTLVAISPNKPDVARATVEEHAITFPVLSDLGNVVARQFKLVYEMDPGMVAYYRTIDRDVGEMNGSERWELPVPATYVVDTAGVIRYAFIDLNHRVRAEPADVLAAAAALVR